MTRSPEQMELEAHREPLEADVRRLVDKYLAIKLIVAAIRQALDRVA